MAWLCDLARRRVQAVERHHPSIDAHTIANSGMHQVLDPAVLRALDHLPPMRRRLIELAFVEGYSNEEIAEKVGLPVDMVQLQLRRIGTFDGVEASVFLPSFFEGSGCSRGWRASPPD